MTVATVHEVPLPPPQKPEREPERSPEREKFSVGVSDSSVWVADVRRRARELSRRTDDGDVSVTVTLADDTRLELADVAAGPGVGFVTLVGADPRRELAVRLHEIQRVELAPRDGGTAFRVPTDGIGFAAP